MEQIYCKWNIYFGVQKKRNFTLCVKANYYCSPKFYVSKEYLVYTKKSLLSIHKTQITEVDLSAFVYRLFHKDFSSLDGTPLSTLPCVIPEQIWIISIYYYS